jgi:hypothetical protein
MLKRPITFENLDGETVTKDYWFNISQLELTELQVSTDEGYGETLQKMMDDENVRGVLTSIKDIILMAYGERDGEYFLKKDKEGHLLKYRFEGSPAFSTLYMELLADDKKATEFILGAMPRDVAKKVALQIKSESEVTEAAKTE